MANRKRSTLTRRGIPVLSLLAATLLMNTSARAEKFPSSSELRQMTARFAPVEIGADVSALPPAERAALGKLVDAARIMDTLYLRQVWAGNETLLLQLMADNTY